MSDITNRRVALGEAGSGTLAEARLVLAGAGVAECRMKATYLRLSDSTAQIEAGKLDAFFLMAGAPVPAIVEAAAMTPLRLVPIEGKLRNALLRAHPFLVEATIPAASYPGIESETQTVAVPALFVASAALADDLVYDITKALWQDATRRILENGHPAGRNIRLANALQGVTIPLHPGAARYYSEHGMSPPAEAVVPSR